MSISNRQRFTVHSITFFRPEGVARASLDRIARRRLRTSASAWYFSACFHDALDTSNSDKRWAMVTAWRGADFGPRTWLARVRRLSWRCIRPARCIAAVLRGMKRDGESVSVSEMRGRLKGSMFHRAREIMAWPAVGTRLYLIGWPRQSLTVEFAFHLSS